MIHDPGRREGNKDYRSQQIWAGPQCPLQTAVVAVYCSALDMPQYGPRRRTALLAQQSLPSDCSSPMSIHQNCQWLDQTDLTITELKV